VLELHKYEKVSLKTLNEDRDAEKDSLYGIFYKEAKNTFTRRIPPLIYLFEILSSRREYVNINCYEA